MFEKICREKYGLNLSECIRALIYEVLLEHNVTIEEIEEEQKNLQKIRQRDVIVL